MQRCLAIVVMSVWLAACGNGDATGERAGTESEAEALGPYGPEFGVRAPVVRAVSVDTTGAVTGRFTGAPGDDVTGLMGLCNPTTFANFMLALPGGEDFDEVWVTNMSKRGITTGETGTFALSYIDVTFRKTTSNDFIQREFRGPGTLTLSTHVAKPGSRRMIGTMEGTGLTGRGDDDGKQLDVAVSFDMDSSCGVLE